MSELRLPFLPGRLRAVAAAVALVVASTTLTFAAAGPAAAASPGSIVFVRDHDVWIADGDGNQQRRITSGGTPGDPWQSPSQSDDGVVVAHRSGLIYRMNQRGEVFNVIDPPDLRDTINNVVSGRDLTETAISPDGTRIAYTYFKLWGGTKRWVTGFTAAGYASDPGYWGLSFYDKPSWVTNNRVVVNAWNRLKTHLYDLGERDIAWFDERSYTSNTKELSDLEVSRDGVWTVATRGDVGDQTIIVLRNRGDVQQHAQPQAPVPDPPCEIGQGDGVLREPVIAPDSSAVAWTEPDGIWRTSDMSCDPQSTQLVRIIDGGSDPHWSPNVVGRTPDVPRTTTPGTPHPSAFTLRSTPKISGKAKVGKVLRARAGTWSPRPTKVRYRWYRGSKAIPKATKASYRVTKRDRGKKLSVRVTVSRPGVATTARKTGAVRVRR